MSLESCGLAPLPGEPRTNHRERVRDAIKEWNANRLDLFEITEPNEDLEFFGAMRFYFQDSGAKMGTKCIRVSSTADARTVVDILIEKFRPDMKMLVLPNYVLYEVHANGFERMLAAHESPLLCQLAWNKDDREGRFLLKSANEKTQKWNDSFGEVKDDSALAASGGGDSPEKEKKGGTFARASKRFSKRAAKKKEKEKLKERENNDKNNTTDELYKSSFSRTISNPEMVMKRRRQLKLEKKLQEFKSKDGNPDRGGTLKIYGESLRSDVPYKTLLLSVTDDAQYVVREILDKYGYENALAADYCLVQVQSPRPEDGKLGQTKATILEDTECPLNILMNHPEEEGIITFHIQKKPDSLKQKNKVEPLQSTDIKQPSPIDLQKEAATLSYISKPDNNNDPLPPHDEVDLSAPVGQRPITTGQEKLLPFLQEVPHVGQQDPSHPPKGLLLQPNVTEVGSERSMATSGQYLQLFGLGIQPRHCVIAHTEGIVTATPCSIQAETFVNNVRIYETAMLQSGSYIRFGKMHTFQFIDPNVEEMNKRRSNSLFPNPHPIGPYQHPPPPKPLVPAVPTTPTSQAPSNYETTFDVDGHVETSVTSSNSDLTKGVVPASHRGPAEGAPSTLGGTPTTPTMTHPQSSSNQPYYVGAHANLTRPVLSIPGDGLPATLEFREDSEDKLLSIIITEVNGAVLQFKLAPTYTQYLVLRRVLSPYYRPDMLPADRTIRVTNLTNKMVAQIHHTIVASQANAGALSFWMANASELLHFIKQDRDLSGMTADAQDTLAEAVQHAFRFLVHCMHTELNHHLPSILDPTDADLDENAIGIEGSSAVVATPVLQTLAAAMSLLRRCRVNAALTIQLFSQLFHYINMWIFNRLVSVPSGHQGGIRGGNGICTQPWGKRLMRRLARIAAWAEKQGLELAADCHLSRVLQATFLLQQNKTPETITGVTAECFKLNSLQLRALLENYSPTPALGENWLPQEVIEHVVNIAQSTADELFASEGRPLRREEDPDLQLPFLLPEDGYSGDILRGVPNGFKEFLDPMITTGLVRLTMHPNASGLWTVHMIGHPIPPEATPFPGVTSTNSIMVPPGNPDVTTVTFKKTKGMGLSIVAAKGVGQDRLGIYIKSVVKGGAAHLDGRLQAGDQLLAVDGHSLIGVSQERAAELMTQTGQMVTLDVAKGGAIYHGLAALLSQPSPVSGGPHIGVSNAGSTYPTSPMQQQPQDNVNLGGNGGPRRMVPGLTMDRLRPKSEMLPSGSQTENGNPHYATLGRNHGNQSNGPGMANSMSVAALHTNAPMSNNQMRSKSTSNLTPSGLPSHLYPGHPGSLRPESEGEEDPKALQPPPDILPDHSQVNNEANKNHLSYPPSTILNNLSNQLPIYTEESQSKSQIEPALQLQDPPLRNPYATYHAQPVQTMPDQPAGRVAPYGAPSSPYNSSPPQSPNMPPSSYRGPAPPTPTRNPQTGLGYVNPHPPLQRHNNSTSSPYHPPETQPEFPNTSLPPTPSQAPPPSNINVNSGSTPSKNKQKLTFEEERKKWLRDEIDHLESLDGKSEDQENKLKFLKLEEEFQKRLDQVKIQENESDDDDEDSESENKIKMESQVRQQMLRAMNEIKEQQQQQQKPQQNMYSPPQHFPHRYMGTSPTLSPSQSPRNSLYAPGRNAPGAIKLGGLLPPPSQTALLSSDNPMEPVTPPEEPLPTTSQINALSKKVEENLRLDREEIEKEERRKERERISAEREMEDQRKRAEEERAWMEEERKEKERRWEEEQRLFEEEERRIKEEEDRQLFEERLREQEAARQKAFEEAYITQAHSHQPDPLGIEDQEILPPPPPEILHGNVSPNNSWTPGLPPPDNFGVFSPVDQKPDDYSHPPPPPPPVEEHIFYPPSSRALPPAVAPKPSLAPKRVSFAGPPPPPPPKPSIGRPVSMPHSPAEELVPPQAPMFKANDAQTAKIGASPPPLLTTAVGNNPRVVGAQEVYRDPREKLLGQKASANADQNKLGGDDPEKLTFKEKMKRFALEAGEAQTPPHKAKASTAQRKLEHLGSPLN